MFKILYTTHVRPHLEYGQTIWSPYLKHNITSVENVQRRATKLIDGFRNIDHQERLRRLDIPTLTFRRERNDMIEIFKQFNTYDKSSLHKNFQHQTRSTRNHGHEYQLVERIPKDGVRGVQYNSFYYRTIVPWNELPRPKLSNKKKALSIQN